MTSRHASSPSADLGPVLSEHRPRPASRLPYLVLAGVALPGAVVSAAVGLGRGYFAYSHLGPAVVWRWSSPALVLAAVLACLGLVALGLLLRPASPVVQVHQGGLRLLHSRRATTVLWSQVREVQTAAVRYRLPGFARRTQAALTLRCRLPETSASRTASFRLSHTLSDFDGLAAAVKRQVYPSLLSEYARAFNQGQSLSFGDLQVSPEGLRKGRRLLPWTDLGAVSLESGVVHLRPAASKRGRELRLAAHRLPNLELCLQLIDYLSHRP